MNWPDLALNSLQWSIRHKTKPNQTLSLYLSLSLSLYIYILSNAKLTDGRNDSIIGFSFFNIHVIQNSKESSM